MSEQKRIAVLTGAGISKESGISTFRDNDGLWDNHKVEDVATPEAWVKNPKLVLDFYNERRRLCSECAPNGSHLVLKKLEPYFHVDIITQNIDDLHERAGSSNILHLHGELNKVRPVNSLNYEGYNAIPWSGDLDLGDLDQEGIQLRPHVVWFGEDVPEISNAQDIITMCDILIIIGTSLSVYPASDLIFYLQKARTVYILDPNEEISKMNGFTLQGRKLIPYYDKEKTTAQNMESLLNELITKYGSVVSSMNDKLI